MSITNICVGLIAVVFLGFMIYLWAQKREKLIKQRRIVDSFPNIISTLGVIGTFLGITLGLVDFDPSPVKIDESISTLLEGLKTAFYTSLAGMGGSIVLRWIIDKIFDKVEEGISSAEAASREICKQIQQMSSQMVDAISNSSASTQAMLQEIQAIKSSQVTFFNSVQSQLDKMSSNNIDALKTNFETLILCSRNVSQAADEIKRQTNNINANTDSINAIASNISANTNKTNELLHVEVDGIKNKMTETNAMLASKFDEFSALLEKSNTEALVEVMKKVTEEFQKQMNDLISRLVQENFEQLNNSVEKLNTWQQENKEMIAALTSQYKQMADEFGQTTQHLNSVSNDTQKLVGNGSQLSKLIAQLNKVMIEDDKYVQITGKLENAVSLTKDSIEKFDANTTKQLEWINKNAKLIDEIKVLVAKLDELNKIRDYSEDFWKDTKKGMNDSIGIITQGSKSLTEQLTTLDRHFYERLAATLGELDACIQAMVNGRN